jgi:hypothetical protein
MPLRLSPTLFERPLELYFYDFLGKILLARNADENRV